MDPDFLTLEDLLEVARRVLPEVAIRDIGLLESAVMRPQTSVFGELAYPTFELQAASLLHSLARNHPLVDGNKRLAWSAMRTFCLMNERELEYSVDDAEVLVLAVATGEFDVAEIASWLQAHQRDSSPR